MNPPPKEIETTGIGYNQQMLVFVASGISLNAGDLPFQLRVSVSRGCRRIERNKDQVLRTHTQSPSRSKSEGGAYMRESIAVAVGDGVGAPDGMARLSACLDLPQRRDLLARLQLLDAQTLGARLVNEFQPRELALVDGEGARRYYQASRVAAGPLMARTAGLALWQDDPEGVVCSEGRWGRR